MRLNIISIRRQLLILVFYALLSFIALHGIIFTTGTHGAGFDFFHFHWNFWWVRQSLTSPDLTLYLSDYVLFPFENNLSLQTLSLVWFPLWAVLEPIIGTLAAMNVIIFAGCTLNGYAFFVFLRHQGVVSVLALISGAVLQVTPLVRYFYFNTHINLMNWFWLPVHLLLWQLLVKSLESNHRRQALSLAVLQGVSLWAMVLSDVQYPLFLGVLLIPYAFYTLFRSQKRVTVQIISFAVMINLVTLFLLWFAGPLPHLFDLQGTFAGGDVDLRPGIPFPRGYLSVDAVWWWWNVPTLGAFVTISLFIAVVVRFWFHNRVQFHREHWVWFLLMIPPFLITLGPSVTVLGAEFIMPFRVLFTLTNELLGMPWRFAPAYIVAAMTFVSLILSPIVMKLRVQGRVLLTVPILLVLILTTRTYEAAPMQPLPQQYAFYEDIGQEEEDYVILEVPVAAGSGEVLVGQDAAITLQYHALTHQKRLINGFIARVPLEHFWYLRTDDPLLSWLGQRRDLDTTLVEPQLRAIIPEWPVGYIIVHKDIIGIESPAVRDVIGYLNSLPDLLCPAFIEGEAVVFRTSWHPAGCPPRTPSQTEEGTYSIDIGAPDDERFLGWGWYWPENVAGLPMRWIGIEEQAILYVDLPPDNYTVIITTQSFNRPRDLTLSINGVIMDTVEIMPDGLQDVTFIVNRSQIGDGKHVTFTLEYTAAEDAPGGRQLALLIDTIAFAPQP